MLATYGQPKETAKLNKNNYSTYFIKWYQEIKKTLGNIGLPAGSAIYENTPNNPDSSPLNDLTKFLIVDATHVSPAKVYGTELVAGVRTVKVPTFEQEMKFNSIVSNYRTAKNRVLGVIQDFTDETLFTVFLSAAGINRNIFKGIQALQKHCLVSHKSNIKAAKNTLQSLRLKHNKHPLSLLQDIQTQVLILAELGYPDDSQTTILHALCQP
ncbi:hypothetical protein BDR26DRAFT_917446 [Obelidium mucronatum]|nr:hypothetical protein BDR26DRAFT_917446 [Obelidium mucronatum]